ncbi:MAG: hypothetical protein RIS64_3222 [Bacteroidota bacterium]|jgi:hypothetical protein
MKAPIVFLILIGMLFFAHATTAQTEKTFAKSFHPQGRQTVVLNLADKVEVREWDNPMVRIQIKITLSNSGEGLLKALVETGRYHLATAFDEQNVTVTAPRMNVPVQLTGGSKEIISYLVFAPRGILVKTDADGAKKMVARLNP